ncbi:hypothetical protein [Syntrophorhabdus aromaticivorans]|nr:hypothetical protein [Syntrophorhabdus aromaticivorans]
MRPLKYRRMSLLSVQRYCLVSNVKIKSDYCRTMEWFLSVPRKA